MRHKIIDIKKKAIYAVKLEKEEKTPEQISFAKALTRFEADKPAKLSLFIYKLNSPIEYTFTSDAKAGIAYQRLMNILNDSKQVKEFININNDVLYDLIDNE